MRDWCFRAVVTGSVSLTLFSVLLSPAVTAAATEEVCWHYYKERRPLAERPGKVAVLLRESDGGGNLSAQLKSTGLDLHSLEEHTIPGWWIADVSSKNSYVSARELVSVVSKSLPSQFATPVFTDDYGGAFFPTPVLLVRFEEGVTEQRAEEILHLMGAGTVLERNWASMSGAYRVAAAAKDGYGVLSSANKLAAMPEVRFAEPDMVFTGRSLLIPNDPGFPDCWGLHNTGQSGGTVDEDMDVPEAWEFQTGSASQSVLVLDTGVQQNHPDINQLAGFDATGENGGGGPVNACDRHGTPVAGCISAIINNNLGTVGVAPGVRVISARFAISNTPTCNGSWSAQFSWTVDSLQHGQNNFVRVTNNSNGYGSSSAAITDKYNNTYTAAGMVHFASAGNDASSTIVYPASLPLVNAVAATNRLGGRASFSNFGAGLDFSAPGQTIYTTDRTGTDGFSSTDYVFVDGTSFASPYTAGVASLMLSQNPGMANFTVETHLQQSCIDEGPVGYDTSFGWGTVNARQALERVAGCTYSLSSSGDSVPSSGGARSFNVTVSSACPWTAMSNVPWITITSGPGMGNGTVNYTVAPNTGPARVGQITLATQTFFVSQAAAPPPANDNFAAAASMSGAAGTVTGANGSATKESGEPNHGGQFGGASVWWNWQAPASGPAVITTDGSSFDTVLGVYLGNSVSGLTLVAQDDDSGEGVRSRVTFAATRGAIYRIAVDGVSGAGGSIQLNWSLSPIPLSYHNPNQKLSVASSGPGFQVLYYNYSTGALSVGSFHPSSAQSPFTQPPAEWIGLFLYDYGPGRFSEGVYRTLQGI